MAAHCLGKRRRLLGLSLVQARPHPLVISPAPSLLSALSEVHQKRPVARRSPRSKPTSDRDGVGMCLRRRGRVVFACNSRVGFRRPGAWHRRAGKSR